MNKNQISNLAVVRGVCAGGGLRRQRTRRTPRSPVQLDAPHLGLIPAPSDSTGAVGTFRVARHHRRRLFGRRRRQRRGRSISSNSSRSQRPDLAFREPSEDTPASGSIAFVLERR